MGTYWVRTAAELELYGYSAQVYFAQREQWVWAVWRADNRAGRPLAKATTKREASARTAARRFILSQPDAKVAHAEETRVHWNGKPFGGGSWSTTRNRGERGPSWVGACGAGAGISSNYPTDRERINCSKCVELIAADEQKAAAP